MNSHVIAGPLIGITLVVLAFTTPAHGQDLLGEEAAPDLRSEFMMLNQNACPTQNLGELQNIAQDYMAPLFADMQAAGEINDWGFLKHAWGDENNFNFYMVTDDHASFVDAWDRFLERSMERHPEVIERMIPLCDLHKDNLYTLHRYGRDRADR